MEPIRSTTFDPGPRGDATAQTTPERQATAEFEAILMQAVFAPVAEAMGFYGDAVVAEAARAIVRVP